MRRSVRNLIVAVTFASATPVVRAQDLAVLWDISGSITAGQPVSPYSVRLRQGVTAIIQGKGVDESQWRMTLPEPLPPELAAVRSGVRLFGDRAKVVVMRFGRFDRQRFPSLPYFEKVEFTADNLTEQDLTAAFPSTASEGTTNKDLAIAGASRYLFDQGSSNWYLLVVSDFNQDSMERLTEREEQIVDDFNTGRVASLSPPIVLRWKQAQNIQLRIYSAKRQTGSAVVADMSRGLLELVAPLRGGRLTTQRPSFSWRWNEKGVPQSYVLVITRSGRLAFQKTTTGTSAVPDRDLPPGDYIWQVFASTTNGSIASGSRAFVIEGRGGLGWLLLVAGLVALLGSLWYWNNRRQAARRVR